ncbi:G-type lectin S-receptor-like serine/threonine-protein kinase At1g11410 [Telopea speciosissima]|uniref:G-type lectin S-receptor-like serine/threonine-protein kinase At1g11410 n=1 Tax=Telopea speciosissima TaxID=54955 RepID=UPI001CC69C81|nr:G-type lectin S-receptor-like serine/threonine-protein kinase At1g11410 [Telopea speciosissima]
MFLPTLTWLCFLLLLLLFQFCSSGSGADTLNQTKSITDGQIIVSTGSNFALGFFSPGNSSYRYVGIWYNKIPIITVVWVANRDNPINDSSGVLSLALDGNLIVSSHGDQRHPLWSTNVSTSSNPTVLKLHNSGNLVLYSGDTMNKILWESFDNPTHIWLPGVKLGLDRRTGLNRVLTSWKSKDDPSRGFYSYGFHPRGSPQLVLYKGSNPVWRAGSWNGQRMSVIPEMTKSYIFSYDFVNNTDEVYLIYYVYNSSIFSILVLNDTGAVQRTTWIERNRQWSIFISKPGDRCDYYGHCGAYGICRTDDSVECSCLPSFQPKSPSDWYLTEWSEGCVRERPLGCGKGDGFLKFVDVKIPDTSMSIVDKNLSLDECERECLKNCSCTAYAPADINGGGSGCVAWFSNLTDIRYYNDGGQDFFLRVDSVELASRARKDKGFLHSKRGVVILTVSLVVGVLSLLLFAACVYRLQKKKRKGAIEQRQQPLSGFSGMNELEDNGTNLELPFIELDVVAAATDNFSPNNKLGEGGYGVVYKFDLNFQGRLFNGKEIAVKRLSRNSGQGTEEFKNEVLLIAKLQHRNLVRLLASCVHEEEKMLIYEYMPNKSLDSFIFDESKRALLDWRKRFEIIVGIARGVLYLHQDSRLRIIHRDLKAGNVLLDKEMNPKISDFGMARIFGGDQIQANTVKVVGTYFGVLLLEIISGTKNRVYIHEDPSMTLIQHVWDLWKEHRALEIVDSFMLENETTMPSPNQPALIMKRTLKAQDSSSREAGSYSINKVTMTYTLANYHMCYGADTLNQTKSITDGQIIVSTGSNFALGFFSPGNSSYRYVGIWYNKIPIITVVWVANRDNPINDSSGVLSLALDGNLIVSSHGDQRHPLWSTNVSLSSNTTVLKLLNSGNLVLYGGDTGNKILWESFDNPTHIWLPGMKLGLDRRTGLNRVLTSWKSKDDPSRGFYSYGFHPRGSPQLVLYKGSNPVWRAGSWNGQRMSGIPEMTESYIFGYDFVNNTDEVYLIYYFYNYNSSIFSRYVLNDTGAVQGTTWIERNRQWSIFYSKPGERCDYYRHCGAYGICRTDDSVECSCLPSFQPKSPSDWYLTEWSEGCVRERPLGCGKGDGFLKFVDVKIPDTSMSVVDKSLSLKECERECLKNCSCTAYAPADINGDGSGCVAWFSNLTDIRYYNDGGQDFFLRVDSVELVRYEFVMMVLSNLCVASRARKDKGFLHSKRGVVILTVSLVVGVLSLLLFAACVYRLQKKKRKGAIEQRQQPLSGFSGMNELEDNGTNLELPFIELDVVAAATDNFSPNNKLGEGGFGVVYKGRLFNGKEIAVKRLSRNSGQGTEEFKNEVLLIAKLQHRNLVRLLASCVHEEEKMLIYEYMPNKSLDSFIFDESKRALLDWRKRFEIIVGIARGVLYLHQDSRLRIIHRDLKAGNVLLDKEMNPKISDFGMARIFGGDQIQANTVKVVGTYGYMPPEYAMQGLFSIKSDVFSFGVLLLEIISGTKNRVYIHEDPSMTLIQHVWDLWKEHRALEIVDSSMGESYLGHEVARCIQVGLLCVQESASDRPTMSSVTFMLENETTMPSPNQPALIMKRTLKAQDSSSREAGSYSINKVTMTVVDPR